MLIFVGPADRFQDPPRTARMQNCRELKQTTMKPSSSTSEDYDTRPSFNYHERIVVTTTEQVLLESLAVLEYNNKDEKRALTTPFPSTVQQLLKKFSATRVLLQASSKPHNEHRLADGDAAALLQLAPRGPSGVLVQVEWMNETVGSHSNHATIERFLALLEQLQHHRILVAPLQSVTQQRLHRHHYVLVNQTTIFVILPMEGSAMAAEGLRSLGRQTSCPPNTGIWNLANPTEYSKKMLHGVISNKVNSRRSIWIELQASRDCFLGTAEGRCQMQHTVGMVYGHESDQTSLAQLLPGTHFRPCPFVNETQVLLPDSKRLTLTNTTNWSAPLWNKGMTLRQVSPSLLTLTKTIIRPNGMANSGTLQTIVTSANYTGSINILDVIPTTYIRPKWTTLRVDGVLTSNKTIKQSGGAIEMRNYLVLQPFTTVIISLEYAPILLNFQLFPADPNRGIEVPPSLLFAAEGSITLYSNSLLLLPPLPDMSMPFNVISLTCTLYVFVIGSIVNMLVKRASEKMKHALNPPAKSSRGVHMIREKIQRIWKNMTGSIVGHGADTGTKEKQQ